MLYDVSSSYYTGGHCGLARFGYSRDRKRGYPQIVYGLLCNGEGCPGAIEVFEGNTADRWGGGMFCWIMSGTRVTIARSLETRLSITAAGCAALRTTPATPR